MGPMALADNPILATGGQIAAIVIGLYAVLFIVIALVFNLVMAILLSWTREKAELVKMLRPTVDSLNKTAETMVDGKQPSPNDNKIIQVVAQGPAQVHKLDRQVEQTTDKAANAVIEFRARTIQVQTVVKAFFTPKLLRREIAEHDKSLKTSVYEIKTPGLQKRMGQDGQLISTTPVLPAALPAERVVPTVPVPNKDASLR